MPAPRSRRPAAVGYGRSLARCPGRRGQLRRHRRNPGAVAEMTRRGPGDRPLAHDLGTLDGFRRRRRELAHRRDSVGEPGAAEPLADERARVGMNVDEPRYDRRVARVDDLAAGRQHAARRRLRRCARRARAGRHAGGRWRAHRRTGGRSRRRSRAAAPAPASGAAAARSAGVSAGARAACGRRRGSRADRRHRRPSARTASARPSSDQASAVAPDDVRGDRRVLAAAPVERLQDRRGARLEARALEVRDRVAVGPYRGTARLERAERQLRELAVAQRESPQLELARALAREDHRFAVGPEGRIEVDEHVVREPSRLAALGKPKIAQRRERRAAAVGRSRDAVHAECGALAGRVERRQIRRRRRDFDGGRGEQMDGLACRRRDAAPPELTVRRVDELRRGTPGGARREQSPRCRSATSARAARRAGASAAGSSRRSPARRRPARRRRAATSAPTSGSRSCARR